MASKFTSRIVLDIEDPKCRNPYCLMAGRSLRSTVKAERLRHQQVHPAITAVGEIPGERIIFNGESGEIVIEDRLGYPEAKVIRDELHHQVKNSQNIFDPAATGGPRPTETYRLHNDDDRASWLMALRQMLDGGCVVVREGAVPTREEINALGSWTKCGYHGFQSQDVMRHKKTEAKVAAKTNA
jgi:hypothetical protein